PDPGGDGSSGLLLQSPRVGASPQPPEFSIPSTSAERQPLSYKSALWGFVPSPSKTQKDWIVVGQKDIISSVTNGIKSLSFSDSFKTKLCKPWTNSVIIRLMGKSIGYAYLCHRLRSMWKPAGSMHVVDIDRDCFIVKFSNEQDYFQALTGGPWMILEHYLVVQQWDPSFRVSGKLPAKMVVWVRFPHLPILLYHPQILAALGNLIGRTVRVDLSTQNTDRGKFARLAVKIDLNEPLAPMIELDGAWRLLNMRISQPFVLSVGGLSMRPRPAAEANKMRGLVATQKSYP
ncbi:hypothetical protein LINPERHAP1_LOCUS27610, partial [Linum perenne]